MTAAEYRILTDCAVVAWVALFFGLTVWAIFRRRDKKPVPIEAASALATEGQDSPPAEAPFAFNHWDLVLGISMVWMVLATSFSLSVPADSAAPSTLRTEVAPGEILANFLIVQGLQMALIWTYFLRVRRANPVKVFGFKALRPSRALAVAFLCIAPAAFVALGVAHWVVQFLSGLGFQAEEQQAVTMLRSREDWSMRLVLAFGACVTAPIVEEVLFRGLFYSGLKRFSDRGFASVLSAVLFGLAHAHLPSLLPLVLLGLCFAWAYEKSKSLTIPILMHALFNTSQIIAALFYGTGAK